MRLKSGIFVSALIRRCGVEGVTAVLSRRGAEEAGAIAIVVDRLDGRIDLYLPAPQSALSDDPSDRLFQRVIDGADAISLDERLRKEQRFDSDLWVVTIEDRAGRPFVDVLPA